MEPNSSAQPPSTLTHEEIGLALRKATEMGFHVIEGDPPAYRPPREMEIAQILEVVYDQRESGATHSIQEAVDQLAARRAHLEAEVAKLEDERVELEASRRIRRAWGRLLPMIRDTSWYKAAMAVRELDDEVMYGD